MHAIVLKFGSFMGNVAISGFVAGVIYFVIALTSIHRPTTWWGAKSSER